MTETPRFKVKLRLPKKGLDLLQQLFQTLGRVDPKPENEVSTLSKKKQSKQKKLAETLPLVVFVLPLRRRLKSDIGPLHLLKAPKKKRCLDKDGSS